MMAFLTHFLNFMTWSSEAECLEEPRHAWLMFKSASLDRVHENTRYGYRQLYPIPTHPFS